ncbi:LrgB family protein, partial [Alloalcanivorax venustensis]|uniref:LrgB family protein n=1 Tax=Alloalcanivorax venustensis TaxID=172371 RepID=UPI003C3D7288
MADLVHSPLFGLLLTLASYRMATWLYGKVHSLPLFHPFIVASIPVIVVLPLVGVSYTEYRDQTQVLSFLLGPATVALAWPLYRQLHTVRSVWRPILITTFIGAALAAGISFLWFRDPDIAAVMAVAMFANMVVAGLSGTLVPLGL